MYIPSAVSMRESSLSLSLLFFVGYTYIHSKPSMVFLSLSLSYPSLSASTCPLCRTLPTPPTISFLFERENYTHLQIHMNFYRYIPPPYTTWNFEEQHTNSALRFFNAPFYLTLESRPAPCSPFTCALEPAHVVLSSLFNISTQWWISFSTGLSLMSLKVGLNLTFWLWSIELVKVKAMAGCTRELSVMLVVSLPSCSQEQYFSTIMILLHSCSVI